MNFLNTKTGRGLEVKVQTHDLSLSQGYSRLIDSTMLCESEQETTVGVQW